MSFRKRLLPGLTATLFLAASGLAMAQSGGGGSSGGSAGSSGASGGASASGGLGSTPGTAGSAAPGGTPGTTTSGGTASTTTPGAPGASPGTSTTTGRIGPGGVPLSAGSSGASVPSYQTGPGGVPVTIGPNRDATGSSVGTLRHHRHVVHLHGWERPFGARRLWLCDGRTRHCRYHLLTRRHRNGRHAADHGQRARAARSGHLNQHLFGHGFRLRLLGRADGSSRSSATAAAERIVRLPLAAP